MANRYWVGGAASWDGTAGTKWALTSGGAGGQAVPTSADDVFFDAASGAVTITIAATSNCLSLNCTGFTGTMAGASQLNVYGNLTLVAGMTRSYTGLLNFASTSTGRTITLGGKTLGGNVTFNGVGGGWTMNDAFNMGTSTLTLTNGSLNTNGQTVTAGVVSSNNSNTRTLTLGASAINLSGVANSWVFTTTTGLTFSANTSTITITAAAFSPVFEGGGLTYNNVTFVNSTSSSVTINGSNTFANLTDTGGNYAIGTLTISANQVITGTFTVNPFSITQRILVSGSPSGTPITLTAATVSIANCDFRDVTGAGTGSWSGSSIGNALGNSGITFTTPVTRYWVGNAGSWNDTAHWSASSGGAGGASVPLCHDTVNINASSITVGGQTITINIPRLGADISFAGVANSPTWATGSNPKIFGSLTLGTMTISNSTGFTFEGRGTHTLNPAGTSFGSNSVVIAGYGGTYTLANNLTTSTAGLSVTAGTFDASTYAISVAFFTANTGSPATLNLGSNTWTITGAAAPGSPWTVASGVVVNAGTSTIKLTDNSATGKSFQGGNAVYNNVWFSPATGTGSYTISNSNTFNDLKDDGTVAHSILITAGTTQRFTTFTVSGGSGQLITLNSTTTGTFTMVKEGPGTVSRDYLNIQHAIAVPAFTWYAGINSVNNQGVSVPGYGWYFSSPPSQGLPRTYIKTGFVQPVRPSVFSPGNAK